MKRLLLKCKPRTNFHGMYCVFKKIPQMKDMRTGENQQNDSDGRNDARLTSIPQCDLLAQRVEIRGAKVKEAENEARNEIAIEREGW